MFIDIKLQFILLAESMATAKALRRPITRLTCCVMERRFSKPPALSRTDGPEFYDEVLFWPCGQLLSRRFGEPPFHCTRIGSGIIGLTANLLFRGPLRSLWLCAFFIRRA